MNVLIAHTSNPISTSRYYVDAFREVADVRTCGPMIDEDELARWWKAEAEHAFKRPGQAKQEKIEPIRALARPCDIPSPRGRESMSSILTRLDGWRPDLFVWVDSQAFLPRNLDVLDCPTVCLVGDTHTGAMDWRIEYAREYGYVFVMFCRQHIPHFEAGGCRNVGWLPAACDPWMHGKVEVPKAYDIGFCGQTHRQWHPDRVRLLNRLMESGFNVCVCGKILQEMSLFYCQCRIVFNRSLNGDLNMRVFEALCSGSMLLTDRLPEDSGLEDLFQDKKHLVLYDEASLMDLADYYLSNPVEREQIADQGRWEVMRAHTYAHRVRQIIETVLSKGNAL